VKGPLDAFVAVRPLDFLSFRQVLNFRYLALSSLKAATWPLQFRALPMPPNEVLYVGRPSIGDREAFLSRVKVMLDNKWLSNNGPFVREFELQLADALGVPHVIATCNATAAIQVASRALGLSGEVIVPSFTFIATVHALHWMGLTPVFADIDPVSHNIAPLELESLITPRTSAIVGVHLWGRGCDTTAIEGIAQANKLRVMYDASHAFGCSLGGRMIGGFGECEVFSFHATKFINCFEGGAIATRNDDLAHTLRKMRNFGFCGYDDTASIGINAKMSEVSAAMGLTNLESIDRFVAANQANHQAYRRGLAGLPGIRLLEFDPAEHANFHYVVIEVDPHEAGISRDALLEQLHCKNVIARRYFWPGCHRMEPYRSLAATEGVRLPHTERVADRVVVLPTGESVAVETVARVCQMISEAMAEAVA
jgi:dTDP-4-amino-4,6-dideoxygalactose transaminase